jgi:SAM-dependent methyltransferase
MTTLYGPLHACFYDRFHGQKDYRAETDQLRGILGPPGDSTSVLDFGCGTARHLDLLAEAGYEVVGVDRSPAMAELARQRLARHGPRARVLTADVAELPGEARFDAVLMMFSLIGYPEDDDALLALLGAARRQLRPGGLLLFDHIDAAAALHGERPSNSVAVLPDSPGTLLCEYRTSIDDEAVDLRLRMWLLEDDRLVDHVEERHVLRFFLRRELAALLRAAGFTLLDDVPLAGALPGPTQEWFRLAWARKEPTGDDLR